MLTAQMVYRMLGNESLWNAAEMCRVLLSSEEVPYSICGGVAVCLHGYQRNTVNLDLVIRSNDTDSVRTALENGGWFGIKPSPSSGRRLVLPCN